MKLLLGILLVIVIIISNFRIRLAYEDGCMDGVVQSYLAEHNNHSFNPDNVVQKHCFNHK